MNEAEKLLVAAKVHEIAELMRAEERAKAEATNGRSGRAFNAFAWDAENPTMGFVPRAVARLIDVQNIIWPPSC